MGRTTESARPITARRAATRERLLTAARQVFAERGIHGAAVEDICEAAGFTRGAFYSNFGSKEELLVALLEAEHEQLMLRLQAVLAIAPPEGVDAIEFLAARLLAAQPLDRQGLLMHGEFVQHGLRDPWAASMLSKGQAEVDVEVQALLLAAITLAGRQLTVSPQDAVCAISAIYEAQVRDMHLLVEAGTEPDLGPPGHAIAVIVRALTEPIPGSRARSPERPAR